MIFDFILFSRLSPAFSSSHIQEDGNLLSFVAGHIIGDAEPFTGDLFYRPAVFKTGNRFCIALQAGILTERSLQKKQVLIDLLGPVFFNPNYLTLDGHPLVFAIPAPGKTGQDALREQEMMIEGLQSVFTQLGYGKFYYCCFTDEDNCRVTGTNIEYPVGLYSKNLEAGMPGFGNWYSGLLEGGIPQKMLLAIKEPALSADAVISEIESIETVFRKEKPSFFALLKENLRLLKQNEDCHIRRHELELDLESKIAYIESAGFQETMLKKVNEFYKYEYEILPMWYKQFGHVIKVLMGKRAFRSLYDDKVKKYKD